MLETFHNLLFGAVLVHYWHWSPLGLVVTKKKKQQDFEVFKKSLKHRILLKSKFFCYCLLGAA